MSRENVEVSIGSLTPLPADVLAWVRERYAIWNEGGPEAMVRQVWHRDITWYDPPDFPDATVQRGADAVAEHLRLRLEALGRSVVTVRKGWWVTEGEVLLVQLSLHSGGQSSGVQLDAPLVHLLRLRGGRTIEVREYMRREQALAALGMAE